MSSKVCLLKIKSTVERRAAANGGVWKDKNFYELAIVTYGAEHAIMLRHQHVIYKDSTHFVLYCNKVLENMFHNETLLGVFC